MKRVDEGKIASALDEFLQARIPIQLGGLHDPFTPLEESRGVTRKILEVLKQYQYPTIISTKGSLITRDDYLKLLKEMNVFVRLSAAAVSEPLRLKVDRRCDSFPEVLEKISKISSRGIPTGLRIQPVIPRFEHVAFSMTQAAANAGARHVSFEHLKIPNDSVHREISALSKTLGFDLFNFMKEKGLKMVGRDYELVAEAKRPFVIEARNVCKKLGLRFGAGDTEFIPWSDGAGCCSGSGFFLKDAQQFSANFVGAVKYDLSRGTSIRFASLQKSWSPNLPVSTYLSSRSRAKDSSPRFTDWLGLLAKRWNGGCGPYSPSFFDGVEWRGDIDSDGFKIYDASTLRKQLTMDV